MHVSQNLTYGGGIIGGIKTESSENSIIKNFKNDEIYDFKNRQKNHDVIDVGFRPQQSQHFVDDDSDEEDPSQGGLTFDDDDEDDIELSPTEWDCNDVIEFLKRNNCSQHCELFMKHKINGVKLLELSQNDIIKLLGMKVGPAIKIFDLIQQIKAPLQ